MTQDNDTERFIPSPPRKSYNPFDSDDDTSDSPGLVSENVYSKEDKIGFISSDALTLCMDENGDLSWEEAIFGKPADNASENGHTNSLEKDGQIYTDKNVTDCELPELVVCCKEDNCQSVKDIGIDEGVPTLDKIWIQSSEDEIKDSDSSLFLAVSKENNDEIKELEKGFCEVNVVEAPKPKLGTELKPPPAESRCGLVYDVVDGHSAAEIGLTKTDSKQDEPDLTGKDGTDHGDTVEKKGNDVSSDNADNQEPITDENPSELSTEYIESDVKPDKSPNEEKTLINSSVEVLAISSDSNNSIVEFRSLASIFNSSKNSDHGKQEVESQNLEPAIPPTTQSMSRQEESSLSNITASSLEPRFHGETSFSSNVSVPLPSSITFTGPVSYSGNISYRSESSAGSTRSFAFPILQTEWNCSPERMVKPDPRHYRKQKGGWVQALICCRF